MQPSPRAAPRPSARHRTSSWLSLGALALGAAGVGFAVYVYAVPYQRLAVELKRRSGELRSVASEAEARRMELDRLRSDLKEVQGARNQHLTEEGRARSDLKVIKTQLEERLAGAKVQVHLEARRMLVRFPEETLFEARGPWFTRAGQEAIETFARTVGDRAGRVLVAAPMGGEAVPRWVRAQYPTPADLSAARAGNALRALAKAGVRADSTLAVIGLLAGPDEANAPATLDIELEPRE